ncbi:MAG: hypothetical protein ACKVUT_15210 [Gaiella sp.]
MSEQSHKREMTDALRGDFARLRARGIASSLGGPEPDSEQQPAAVEQPVAVPEPPAVTPEPARVTIAGPPASEPATAARALGPRKALRLPFRRRA